MFGVIKKQSFCVFSHRRQIFVRQVCMLGQNIRRRVVHLVLAAQQQNVAKRLERTRGRTQFQQEGEAPQAESTGARRAFGQRQIVQRHRIEFRLGARRQIEQRLAGTFDLKNLNYTNVYISC